MLHFLKDTAIIEEKFFFLKSRKFSVNSLFIPAESISMTLHLQDAPFTVFSSILLKKNPSRIGTYGSMSYGKMY